MKKDDAVSTAAAVTWGCPLSGPPASRVSFCSATGPAARSQHTRCQLSLASPPPGFPPKISHSSPLLYSTVLCRCRMADPHHHLRQLSVYDKQSNKRVLEVSSCITSQIKIHKTTYSVKEMESPQITTSVMEPFFALISSERMARPPWQSLSDDGYWGEAFSDRAVGSSPRSATEDGNTEHDASRLAGLASSYSGRNQSATPGTVSHPSGC